MRRSNGATSNKLCDSVVILKPSCSASETNSSLESLDLAGIDTNTN